MPSSPPKPCNTPGCRALVKGSAYCATHAQKAWKASSQTPRGSRHERGYTNQWARASKAFLAQNPLCRRCAEEGIVQAARITDHISPHKGDMVLFWDVTNWQPLCKPCHDAKTAREDGPAMIRPEWLKKPGGRVFLVCGPPGAGKSTLVRERAAAADTVIDLDEIVAELAGKPIYQAGGSWLSRGIRERNRRLAALHAQPPDRVAWVILTGSADHRDWWIQKLQPVETIVLRTPEHICSHRITSDPRRRLIAEKQCAAVRRWWLLERASEEMAAGAGEGEGGGESLPGFVSTGGG